jgi:hypothetical protein
VGINWGRKKMQHELWFSLQVLARKIGEIVFVEVLWFWLRQQYYHHNKPKENVINWTKLAGKLIFFSFPKNIQYSKG